MQNQNLQQSPKNYVRLISIIHIALFLGQLLFAIVAVSLTFNANNVKILIYESNDPLSLVAPLTVVGGITASIFIFKKQLGIAITKDTLQEKLAAYQGALIMRFAFLEGPALFCIALYFSSANLFYIIMAGVLLLYFLSIRPTKDRIENDLNLSYEEKIIFDSESA